MKQASQDLEYTVKSEKVKSFIKDFFSCEKYISKKQIQNMNLEFQLFLTLCFHNSNLNQYFLKYVVYWCSNNYGYYIGSFEGPIQEFIDREGKKISNNKKFIVKSKY